MLYISGRSKVLIYMCSMNVSGNIFPFFVVSVSKFKVLIVTESTYFGMWFLSLYSMRRRAQAKLRMFLKLHYTTRARKSMGGPWN